jgi:hypothetical protein
LPPQYIEQLKADMDPKLARRMIYGEWIEISGEVIYSEYNSELQYRRTEEYKIDPHYPVVLTFDFNLSSNKPMSMCCLQYIDDTFHVFAEVIIDGARTGEVMEELNDRGLLKPELKYTICGDASGKHRDTRSFRSDYDIIFDYLKRAGLKFEYMVPPANPPVRLRHNRVNAYCLNALGERRLFLYKGCATLDEGMRLTKLKPGANYLEDDSKPYQHVTTAIAYAIVALSNNNKRQRQSTLLL